jgi:hypothetical protein
MTTVPTHLRRRETLDGQLAHYRETDSSFGHGAAAALHWLIAGGFGPLTGALLVALDSAAVDRELAVADSMIYGPPSPGREYATGVEHALLWAGNTMLEPSPPG